MIEDLFAKLLIAVVSGLVGGSIGGMVAWGGIKIRLEHLEDKIACMGTSVVYKDVCQVSRTAYERQHVEILDALKEIRQEIKTWKN
jgi:uncharacterized membrane protein YeiH